MVTLSLPTYLSICDDTLSISEATKTSTRLEDSHLHLSEIPLDPHHHQLNLDDGVLDWVTCLSCEESRCHLSHESTPRLSRQTHRATLHSSTAIVRPAFAVLKIPFRSRSGQLAYGE